MAISRKEFQDKKHKTIALVGMSGVGKTYLSAMLSTQGWAWHNCDLEIGRRYLAEDIRNVLQEEITISADDLSQLSRYLGLPGDTEKGGLPLEEFRRRQKQYKDAEVKTLVELPSVLARAIRNGNRHCVIDTTGSYCELQAPELFELVGENALVVYIEAAEEDRRILEKRAQAHPKPLYYPPDRLEEWVAEFCARQGCEGAHDMPPEDFTRWVFSVLLNARLPKYQSLADRYGVTIPAAAFRGVQSEQDILKIIEHSLPA